MKTTIVVGAKVRSQDFPGTRTDCYVEGIVTEVDNDRVHIHVVKDVAMGVEQPLGARLIVWASLLPNSFTAVKGVEVIE